MSATKRDYYEILGVDRACDEQSLKSAYKKLARQFHPDLNPGDHTAEDKFKEANEAYSILSDPQKRAAYDRFGHQGVAGAASQGFDGSGFPDLSDILSDVFGFSDMFGGSRQRRNRAQRGKMSATISKSALKIRCAASPWISKFRGSKSAPVVTARAPSRTTVSPPARRVAAAAK